MASNKKSSYLVLRRTQLADGVHYPPEVLELGDKDRPEVLTSRGFLQALNPVEAAGRPLTAAAAVSDRSTLEGMTVKDLKIVAREYEVEGISGLDREGLIKAIKKQAGYRTESSSGPDENPGAEPAHPESHSPADHTEPEPSGVSDPTGHLPAEKPGLSVGAGQPGGEAVESTTIEEGDALPVKIDLSNVSAEEPTDGQEEEDQAKDK